MHILIIDGDKRSRELAARYLSEADHEVEAVNDSVAGRSILGKRVPEVIILDMYAVGGRLNEFISWIRTLESAQRPYLILTLSKQGFPQALATALERGADDFVRKPWLSAELLFRVNTLQRIQGFQTGAHDKHMDWSGERDITTMACWQSLEHALANDLAEVLCTPLISRPVQEGLLHACFAAEIPMTMTQSKAEVQIGVGLDAPSASRIAKTMFDMDEPPVEVVQDLLREFANTAGGAFKRSAEIEQIDITTGLPQDVEPGAFSSSDCVDRRHFMLATPNEDIHIYIEVELRSRGLHKLKIADLKEGMVLSRDLLNSTGMLLVRSGTRLTSSNVERLAQLMSKSILVEVAA